MGVSSAQAATPMLDTENSPAPLPPMGGANLGATQAWRGIQNSLPVNNFGGTQAWNTIQNALPQQPAPMAQPPPQPVQIPQTQDNQQSVQRQPLQVNPSRMNPPGGPIPPLQPPALTAQSAQAPAAQANKFNMEDFKNWATTLASLAGVARDMKMAFTRNKQSSGKIVSGNTAANLPAAYGASLRSLGGIELQNFKNFLG